MLIDIKPLDTVFFKDAKPFSMGDESWADGIFPPSPSVFYGALRSLYFSENPDAFKEWMDNGKDATEGLIIKKIYYRHKENTIDTFYFPAPLDLVKIKDDDKFLKLNHLPLHGENMISSFPNFEYILGLKNDLEVENVENGLIRDINIKGYLNNNITTFTLIPMSKYLKKEAKVGIAINKNSRAVDEGKMYRVSMNRMENFSFVLEVEGFEDLKDSNNIEFSPDNKVIKIGGEGKTAYCTIIQDKTKVEPDFSQFIDNDYIKLYFLTPAVFKNGWLPKKINEKDFTGIFEYIDKNNKEKKVKLKLLSAVIGKCLNIGGFDMKANKPKPMRKMIPQGSVYYFKKEELSEEEKKDLEEGTLAELANHLHGSSLSEYDCKQGFGVVFAGAWKI